MPDNDNQDNQDQDKPSFFDFGKEDDDSSESRAWPPSDGYDADDDDASSQEADSDMPSFLDASGDDESNADDDDTPAESDDGSNESAEESSGDSNDESAFPWGDSSDSDDAEASESEASDFSFESSTDSSEDEASNDDTEDSFLKPAPASEEPEEPEEPSTEASDEDVDVLFGGSLDSSALASAEGDAAEDKPEEPASEGDDISADPLFGGETTPDDPGNLFFNSVEGFENVSESTSEESEVGHFDPTSNKPYKAYASYDYSDEDIIEEFEEEEKKGIQLSRPAIIFLLSLLLVGGYLIYDNVFNRKLEPSGARRRVRKERKKKIFEIEKELVPLWDITAQKGKSWKENVELIRTSLSEAGRENPFSLPDSILNDIRKDIEAQIAKDVAPEVLKKTAYRATLTGIVASKGETLALVQLRTAIFDVTEGTEKPKVIKSATKAMNKAKDDSLEVFEGDYLGPWKITQIYDGRDSGAEPMIRIESAHDYKELRMGRPAELGIYNQLGELDTFKEDLEAEEGEEEDSEEG